jgi:hypothetical protein
LLVINGMEHGECCNGGGPAEGDGKFVAVAGEG